MMADGQDKDGQVQLEVQQAEQAQGEGRAEERIKCGAERQDGGKIQRDRRRDGWAGASDGRRRRAAGRERDLLACCWAAWVARVT